MTRRPSKTSTWRPSSAPMERKDGVKREEGRFLHAGRNDSGRVIIFIYLYLYIIYLPLYMGANNIYYILYQNGSVLSHSSTYCTPASDVSFLMMPWAMPSARRP